MTSTAERVGEAGRWAHRACVVGLALYVVAVGTAQSMVALLPLADVMWVGDARSLASATLSAALASLLLFATAAAPVYLWSLRRRRPRGEWWRIVLAGYVAGAVSLLVLFVSESFVLAGCSVVTGAAVVWRIVAGPTAPPPTSTSPPRSTPTAASCDATSTARRPASPPS